MKKLLTLFSLVAIFFIAPPQEIMAQSFATTIIKMDTATIKPSTAYKIGVNKLNNKLSFWDKVSWKNIPLTMQDTATLDFASSGATTVSDKTVTIPGARLGMDVFIGVPHGSVTATASYFGWVSASNTVTIRFSPKATENPDAGVFHVSVIKY